MNENYEVIINNSARKDIRKLPAQEVKKIVPAIRSLANNQDRPGAKNWLIQTTRTAFAWEITGYFTA